MIPLFLYEIHFEPNELIIGEQPIDLNDGIVMMQELPPAPREIYYNSKYYFLSSGEFMNHHPYTVRQEHDNEIVFRPNDNGGPPVSYIRRD